MPTILTLIEVVEEGPRAEHLLDELQRRLVGTAKIGRDVRPIPVQFRDDLPETEQRRALTSTLDAVDEAERKQREQHGDWQEHLAVTDLPGPSPRS